MDDPFFIRPGEGEQIGRYGHRVLAELPHIEALELSFPADFGTGALAGLRPSLVDAIEADGGLWYAGDHYIDAASVVARAREVNALALRLDFRDLSLLDDLPKVRYLHLRSDGRPPLGPVAGLTKLRALILGVSALRGELDLAAFPQLRWLRASLGGKGGEALRESLSRGHPRLEHLSLTEVRPRTLD